MKFSEMPYKRVEFEEVKEEFTAILYVGENRVDSVTYSVEEYLNKLAKTTEREETAGRMLEKFPGGNPQPSRAMPG